MFIASCCNSNTGMLKKIIKYKKNVHRFLWRNFNTQREPDVYVKTVLTFGDKPAPAMAQTALRKTAEEKRDEYPEAAETHKKFLHGRYF